MAEGNGGMRPEREWNGFGGGLPSAGDTGMGTIKLALLFGSAAIAVGLIVAPFAESRLRSDVGMAAGAFRDLDMTSTGSVRSSGTYTVRKSVLQQYPGAVCIIRDDGRRVGDC